MPRQPGRQPGSGCASHSGERGTYEGIVRAAAVGAGLSNAVNNLPAYIAGEAVIPVANHDQLIGLLIGTSVGPVIVPWASGALMAACALAAGVAALIAMPLHDHGDWMSLPFLDTYGLVQAARLKQQGRRFPLSIFEILTSTRRLRVSGFLVALTQRTHSQRAIGVMSFQRS